VITLVRFNTRNDERSSLKNLLPMVGAGPSVASIVSSLRRGVGGVKCLDISRRSSGVPMNVKDWSRLKSGAARRKASSRWGLYLVLQKTTSRGDDLERLIYADVLLTSARSKRFHNEGQVVNNALQARHTWVNAIRLLSKFGS